MHRHFVALAIIWLDQSDTCTTTSAGVRALKVNKTPKWFPLLYIVISPFCLDDFKKNCRPTWVIFQIFISFLPELGVTGHWYSSAHFSESLSYPTFTHGIIISE